VAMTLAGCGSVTALASSVVMPCEATHYWAAAWSPDGQYIAFDTHETGSASVLTVIRPDGSTVLKVNHEVLYEDSMQWLSDSQTVVITDDNQNTISTFTLDGEISVLPLPTAGTDNMRLSPDGERVAYNPSAFGTATGLDVVNADGTGHVDLSNAFDYVEQWSPDGTRIAYIHEVGGTSYVATMLADGSDKRELAEGVGPVSWSPDGQWLSFFARSGTGLHVIRTDATSATLAAPDLPVSPVSWLPDSQHLSLAKPGGPLKVIDVNTLAVETVSSVGVVGQSAPTWSFDGEQTAFIGYDYVPQPNVIVEELFVINRDGTGQIRLTDNPGRYQCFNWPF